VDKPITFTKKVKLILESSLEKAVQLIERRLKEYKGDEVKFGNTERGRSASFNIGTGVNKVDVFLYLTLEGKDINPKTILQLEVTAPLLNQQDKPEHIMERLNILIKDLLLHTIAEVEIKGKATILKEGKECPKCGVVNDIDAKFCKECAFSFSKLMPTTPRLQQKQVIMRSTSSSLLGSQDVKAEPSTENIIKILNRKYALQYECEFCDVRDTCPYKKTFILLLKDIKNLKEPFKKFDAFLHTKDIETFSNYIYEFALNELEKHPEFSRQEINNIAYCIFSILSFHILEKANRQVRLAFARKMKEKIKARYFQEFPSKATAEISDSEGDLPIVKMGSLHIEENRCPYCYKKFDERTLKLKIKGYPVHCPNCDYEL